MSIIGQNILAGSSGAAAYTIDNSCRFDDGAVQSLYKSFASDGDLKTWTLSLWFKRGNLYGSKLNTDYLPLLEVGGGGNLRIYSPTGGSVADQWSFLTMEATYGSGTKPIFVTQNEPEGPNFRDPTGWYHLVWRWDTTQATSTDRVTFWINGVQLIAADFSTAQYPSLNYDGPWLGQASGGAAVGEHDFGVSPGTSTYRYDGLMAQIQMTDGIANAADAFGKFDPATGQWIPIEYLGNYGSNGFFIDFADSSDFGKDVSGEGNDWSASSLVATDQLPDSPTNNYCVMNSNVRQTSPAVTLSQGNLVANEATGSTWASVMGTMAVASGKWYWEMLFISSATALPGWIGDNNWYFASNEASPQNGGSAILQYTSNGNKRIDGTSTAYGASVAAGDIIGIALDLDSGTRTITFYKNNASQGAIDFTGELLNAALFIPACALYSNTCTYNFGQDSSFDATKTAQNNADANGNGDFYYAPPANHLALCTDNLAAPAIADPGKHFESVYWTGNGTVIGSGGKAVTGVGFEPDCVWAKSLSAVSSHLDADKLRGVTKYMSTNNDAIQITDTESLTSFDSDGFTVGSASLVNTNTANYRAWNWLAAGLTTGATNNEGATTSYVSANPTAGFSIVLYTGTGSSTTIGHGLSGTPGMVIVKSITTVYAWKMVHQWFTSGTYYMDLSTDSYEANGSAYFGAFPGATSFTIGTENSTNESGKSFVAYCFAPIPGFSQLGRYRGNGSNNGPWVPTGFRPAATLIFRGGGTANHGMNDYLTGAGQGVFNEVNAPVWVNDTAAADLANSFNMDYCASGFKIRRSDVLNNADNEFFYYYAVAQYPFKYADAR